MKQKITTKGKKDLKKASSLAAEGIENLELAVDPQTKAEICLEKAIAAHVSLSRALSRVESYCRKHAEKGGLTIEAVTSDKECPTAARQVLILLSELSKELKYHYLWDCVDSGLKDLIRQRGEVANLIDVAKYSRNELLILPQVGAAKVEHTDKFLQSKGFNLRKD